MKWKIKDSKEKQGDTSFANDKGTERWREGKGAEKKEIYKTELRCVVYRHHLPARNAIILPYKYKKNKN